MIRQVAALCVDPKGVYSTLPAVDLWDEARDARNYLGDDPIVGHPPCARWSRLAPLVEARHGYPRGDDGGVFASVLGSLLRCGGVVEHPAVSAAWRAHRLTAPPSGGGWVRASLEHDDLWTCHVEQGHFGHDARKPTWLLVMGLRLLPSLPWGRSSATALWSCYGPRMRPPEGAKLIHHRDKRQLATPPAFAALLLSMARGVDLGRCP